MTDIDLDALEATARAATPGPWELIGNGEYVTGIGVMVAPDDGGIADRDAEHIAAFDPPTVLALIARIREAEAVITEALAVSARYPRDSNEVIRRILSRYETTKTENTTDRENGSSER